MLLALGQHGTLGRNQAHPNTSRSTPSNSPNTPQNTPNTLHHSPFTNHPTHPTPPHQTHYTTNPKPPHYLARCHCCVTHCICYLNVAIVPLHTAICCVVIAALHCYLLRSLQVYQASVSHAPLTATKQANHVCLHRQQQLARQLAEHCTGEGVRQHGHGSRAADATAGAQWQAVPWRQ